MKIMIVDVGGSHIKFWNSDDQQHERIRSNPEMTAREMVEHARPLAREWQCDRVTLGLPCRVVRGRPVIPPPNLGSGWVEADYEAYFELPVRIVNDADLQAIGSYDGGRMLFVGLGTAVGTTLIAERTVIALDLAQWIHDGHELFKLLGKQGQRKYGKSVWEERVHEIVPQLKAAVFAEDVVLGGGQAKKLEELPAGTRRGDNTAVRTGAIRLWTDFCDDENSERPWRLLG